MKKTIFALGLIATLASCGNGKAEGEAANADSTAVAVDSVATTTVVADSAKVDSVATK
jgi:hypothetical protein